MKLYYSRIIPWPSTKKKMFCIVYKHTKNNIVVNFIISAQDDPMICEF